MDNDHDNQQRAAHRTRDQTTTLMPEPAVVPANLRRECSRRGDSNREPRSKGTSNLRKMPRTETSDPHA